MFVLTVAVVVNEYSVVLLYASICSYHRVGNFHVENNLRENFSCCWIFAVSFNPQNFYTGWQLQYRQAPTNLRNDVGGQCMPPWMLGQLAKLGVELFVIQKLWGHLSESNWWAEISNLQSTWNIASYPGSFSRRKRKWAWVRGNVEHTFTCTKNHQYKRCVL